jgi:hypothetical protein
MSCNQYAAMRQCKVRDVFPQSIDAMRNEKSPPARLLAQRIGGYFS